MFQFEIGLPAGDPLQAWARVAEHMDFDPAVGLMFSSYLEYLPSGEIRHFSVQAPPATTGRCCVNWPGVPGGGKIASIESAPPGFMGGGSPTAFTVHSALSALAAVGHDSILAKLPAPGETGYYYLQLPVDVGYLQSYHLLARGTDVCLGRAVVPACRPDRYQVRPGGSVPLYPRDVSMASPSPKTKGPAAGSPSDGSYHHLRVWVHRLQLLPDPP